MHEVSAKKGDFTLFALFRRADGLGKWDLVVSAPWLTGGKLKALSELVELVAKSIGKASLAQLARVETVPGDNCAVKDILHRFPVEDGELRIGNTDLFGLQIEEAIILRAMRPTRKRPPRNALHPAAAESLSGRG
jgi:hypothetical protein